MQGVPLQFSDEKDRARFRHLEQLPGVELYHAHISRYAFEPHTHEAFGIGVIEQGAERFRYRGSQHIAAANSIVTMNPDEPAHRRSGNRRRLALPDDLSGAGPS